MSTEIECHLCRRPTRNTTRYFCPDQHFHTVCRTCEPLMVVFDPPKHPRVNDEDRAIFCPTQAPEELRVLAALREPEKIPADFTAIDFEDVLAGLMTAVAGLPKGESANVSASKANAKALVDKLLGMNLQPFQKAILDRMTKPKKKKAGA